MYGGSAGLPGHTEELLQAEALQDGVGLSLRARVGPEDGVAHRSPGGIQRKQRVRMTGDGNGRHPAGIDRGMGQRLLHGVHTGGPVAVSVQFRLSGQRMLNVEFPVCQPEDAQRLIKHDGLKCRGPAIDNQHHPHVISPTLPAMRAAWRRNFRAAHSP